MLIGLNKETQFTQLTRLDLVCYDSSPLKAIVQDAKLDQRTVRPFLSCLWSCQVNQQSLFMLKINIIMLILYFSTRLNEFWKHISGTAGLLYFQIGRHLEPKI